MGTLDSLIWATGLSFLAYVFINVLVYLFFTDIELLTNTPHRVQVVEYLISMIIGCIGLVAKDH